VAALFIESGYAQRGSW